MYAWNLPGRPCVCITDPKEGVKVIQNEGKYPSGVVAEAWPFKNYNDKGMALDNPARGFTAHGKHMASVQHLCT